MSTSQLTAKAKKSTPNQSERKSLVKKNAPELADMAGMQAALGNLQTARPETILQLQRMAGNRAVTGLIQRKMVVGPAHDHYEQEADRLAKQVMRAPSAPLQRMGEEEDEPLQAKPLANSITPLVQRQTGQEEERQAKPISGGESFAPGEVFESRLASQQGGGQPLPGDTRVFMESRFGADFSGVRVHTDSASVQLNREVQAQAFTHGNDIYMGEGKYNPQSESGRELLAHELTHTIQQGGGGMSAQRTIQRKLTPAQKKARRDQLKEVLSPERFARLSSNYFIETKELLDIIIAEKDAINEMDDAEFDALVANEDMEKRLRALTKEGLGWFGRKTLLGKAMSRVGYGGFSREGEGDWMVGGGEKEGSKDYGEKDDQEFLENDETPLSIKKVEITLVDADSAKFERDKGIIKGEGNAELKANVEGLEGKAQVSFEMGKSSKKKKEDIVDWNVAGANLKGGGTLAGFMGARMEGKAKGALGYSKEKGFSASGRGKASAFAGFSVEAETEVSIKAGKDNLVKASGKLGAALGVGGELAGKIEWEGGNLSFGAKGKVAAGLGFSWEYKLEVNVQSIAAKFFSWLKGWGLWLLGY